MAWCIYDYMLVCNSKLVILQIYKNGENMMIDWIMWTFFSVALVEIFYCLDLLRIREKWFTSIYTSRDAKLFIDGVEINTTSWNVDRDLNGRT